MSNKTVTKLDLVRVTFLTSLSEIYTTAICCIVFQLYIAILAIMTSLFVFPALYMAFNGVAITIVQLTCGIYALYTLVFYCPLYYKMIECALDVLSLQRDME